MTKSFEEHLQDAMDPVSKKTQRLPPIEPNEVITELLKQLRKGVQKQQNNTPKNMS